MTIIGLYEARTRLSELLDDVANGKQVLITRRGKPASVISPLQSPRATMRTTTSTLPRNRKKARVEVLRPLSQWPSEGRQVVRGRLAISELCPPRVDEPI